MIIPERALCIRTKERKHFKMPIKDYFKKSAAILLLAAALISCCIYRQDASNHCAPSQIQAAASASKNIRGVWISFHDFKSAGLYQKSQKDFTANAVSYFKKLKKDGINTVFFHVVPCNDSIYPSEYLPWSPYMFESEPDYDPLEILIETAHACHMTFHAWINPYRKTMDVIYNPGKTSSTNRIIRIIKEIMENYDVDGIHFDDYFYPSRTKGAQFYDVPVTKRKAVINKMVKKVYRTIKNYDEDLLFGISPAGVIENAINLGCDLNTWLSQDGYLDYIIPQIYWTDQFIMNGKKTKLFTSRLDQWIALNQNDTPMYIGLGLYRGGTKSDADLGWSRKSNNIVSQIKQLKRKGCEGFVLFSSSYLYNSLSQKEADNYRKYISK